MPATPKYKESSKILTINKKPYQILAPLGKGGSSKVYLVGRIYLLLSKNFQYIMNKYSTLLKANTQLEFSIRSLNVNNYFRC